MDKKPTKSMKIAYSVKHKNKIMYLVAAYTSLYELLEYVTKAHIAMHTILF